MKYIFIMIALTVFMASCSDEKVVAEDSRFCASSAPTLVGKWVLTEFRYYGGCCPVIADSSWKQASTTVEQRTIIEFTSDGKIQSVLPSAVSLNNASVAGTFATPTAQVTNYRFNGKEITLEQQILGGAPWYKIIPVKKLTTTELTLQVLVGKEGEMNDRRYRRICE